MSTSIYIIQIWLVNYVLKTTSDNFFLIFLKEAKDGILLKAYGYGLWVNR